jgi:hypothetical protein
MLHHRPPGFLSCVTVCTYVRRRYNPRMVHVTIEGDNALFTVEGLHKLWCFRGRLEIPLAHITDVEVNADQVGRWWHGFKVLGTDVPGLFGGGTFYYHGELVFWDVVDPARTIIVWLDDERYRKLIVEVADPEATAATLRAAIRR